MWNLLRLSLAYHRRTLVTAWGIAFGLGLIEILIAWIRGGAGELEPERWLLFPYLGFVATAIAGLVTFEIEDKERRALLHLPLPVTRIQVGLARVVLPALIITLGTAATALLGCAIFLAAGGMPTANTAWQLLFSATLLMFFLQLLLAFLTFVRGGRERLRSLLGIAALVVLLLISITAWMAIVMASSGSYLMVGLGTAAMTLGLMGLSVALFERRESFTSG